MLGAIAGDMIGSPYERHAQKDENFPLFSRHSCFTDDSVLTVATADALLNGRGYAEVYREYYRAFPYAGFAGKFETWARSNDAGPYHSFGNGSAMRVSPVAWFHNDLDRVLAEAKKSAEVTHNHPEGIKGAQATAAAIFLARRATPKDEIRQYIINTFAYNLKRSVAGVRLNYRFDVSCQGSVPEAILCFLEADSYEESVRKAVSLGGDADTQGCIAGSIAEAYFGGVPSDVAAKVYELLDPKLVTVTRSFHERFCRVTIAGQKG